MLRREEQKTGEEVIPEELKQRIALSVDEELFWCAANLLQAEEHLLQTLYEAPTPLIAQIGELIAAIRSTRVQIMKQLGISNPAGQVWCLPPGTWIFTETGLKRIEEVRIGERVLSAFGGFTEVVDTMKRRHVGKLIEIRTGMTVPLLITPEHPVLVVENVRVRQGEPWREKYAGARISPVWKPAEEVTDRDFMLIPKLAASLPDFIDLAALSRRNLKIIGDGWAVHATDYNQNRFRSLIDLDERFYELLGLYLAEGCIARHGFSANLSLYFGAHEKLLAERAKKLFSEVFGCGARIWRYKDCMRVDVTNSTIADFFSEFGSRSEEKTILGGLIPYGDLNRASALFKGLVEGDGRVDYHLPSIQFSTSSPSLAGQVYLLLVSVGATPRIRVAPPASSYSRKLGRIIRGRHPSFCISVSGDNCELLGFEVRERESHKGMRAVSTENFMMIPIYGVEERSYDGIVYNLSTRDETYVTLSGAVHNCASKHLISAAYRLMEASEKSITQLHDPGLAKQYSSMARRLLEILLIGCRELIAELKAEKEGGEK